jgi:hypothetical protein
LAQPSFIKNKRLTAESAEDAETIKFQNLSTKSHIIVSLQYTRIPSSNVLELECGIYLGIGYWDLGFLLFLCVLCVLCGERFL